MHTTHPTRNTPSRRAVLKGMTWAAVVLMLVSTHLSGTPARADAPELFPFDNGLTDVKSVEDQAALLKELGYAGICTRPQHATEQLFAAFDKHGLKVMATYVVLKAKPNDCPVPQQIIDHINSLKGRNTIIWLGVTGKTTDDVALAAIGKVADLAKANGLQTVLYPHVGFYTDTVKNCLRLVKKANRPDLGLSFNVCHFLKQNAHTELEATIRAAAPHIKLVQINGAVRNENRKAGWDQLIQPLGQGNFDLMRVLRTLRQVGYNGPYNLQCYKINQPARDHLKASMEAWKKYHAN